VLQVARKMEETDVVMAEVDATSQQYLPLASSCSSIYFTLEALKQVRRRRFLTERTVPQLSIMIIYNCTW